MASKQEVASLIVDFLNISLKNGDIPDDNRDSIDFAIESITDVFEVDSNKINEIKAKFGNKSLSELLVLSKASESEAPTTSTESVPVHIDESDEQTKEKAETLKLEGNRAMAAKDYDTAIAKYTAAIELIPTNAVYLSNRAAAYSSLRKHDLALEDAKKATEVEPTYAKGWSRLGLANYALGNAEESLKAYEKGLQVEGSTPSDAMKRGYETAKKKVGDNLMNSLNKAMSGESDGSDLPTPVAASAGVGSDGSAGAAGSGLPDFSAFANMMGGGESGGFGGLSGLMNNPQIMQAAAQMMQDPNALSNLMNNPQVKQMANSMGINPDNLDGIANNPMLQNLAKNFMGGNNNDNSDN
jgi:small glutamine-rich tetratricopeptide repeat-containing protein alpha